MSLSIISPKVSGWIHTYAAGQGQGWHSHEEGQLIYACRGGLQVFTRGECWISPALTAVWLPGGQPHSWLSLTDAPVLSLYMSGDNPAWEKHAAARHISPLLHALLMRVIDEGNGDVPPPTLPLIRSELDRSRTGAAVWLAQPADHRLAAVCRYLDERPDDDRPLAWWSEHTGIEPRTLARRFVRQTGLTFGDWRRRNRLQQAILRLAQGLPVKQAAAETGYMNARSFNTMFKKNLGITPARFLSRRD
ncbi:AraC family transcriptional regulator [Sodalis sp. RH16]|uniref:AraC family transcriptional regulator n=1 Tax=Sodalis sp. RH16 TaxID=3394331 RepID=UPI0039B6867D